MGLTYAELNADRKCNCPPTFLENFPGQHNYDCPADQITIPGINSGRWLLVVDASVPTYSLFLVDKDDDVGYPEIHVNRLYSLFDKLLEQQKEWDCGRDS